MGKNDKTFTRFYFSAEMGEVCGVREIETPSGWIQYTRVVLPDESVEYTKRRYPDLHEVYGTTDVVHWPTKTRQTKAKRDPDPWDFVY